MERRPVVGETYRHFKNKNYKIVAIAHHSETLEDYVVYQALYGQQEIWVRPAAMWNETIERNGRTFQRFTLIEE